MPIEIKALHLLKRKLNDMTPFKEKDKEQYYKDESGSWLKTNESTIMSLWHIWASHEKAFKYEDDDGFLVFDFKQ